MPVMFQGNRVTGYTQFRLPDSDIVRLYSMAHAGQPDVKIVGRVQQVPGSQYLLLDPESIVPWHPEPLPNWDATLEQEPLDPEEEDALLEFCRLSATAILAHPDSSMGQDFRENIVGAFTRLEDDSSWQNNAIQIPAMEYYDDDGNLRHRSLYEAVRDHDNLLDMDACTRAIMFAVIFFVAQLVIGTLKTSTRNAVKNEALRLWRDPGVRGALNRMADVFTRRGLRGNQRGDLLRSALTNLITVAVQELSISLRLILKTLGFWQYVKVISRALAYVVAIASVVSAIFGLVTTMNELAKACGGPGPLARGDPGLALAT